MEPEFSKFFNPVKFILSSGKIEQIQCVICLEKQVNLFQCKNCKNKLCNKCAIDQKRKNNKCPYKCTPGPLLLQPAETHFQYRCPFSNQCKKLLKSIKQFYGHDRQCQFISFEQSKMQKRKWEFKCINDHLLQVYRDAFQKTLIRRKCAQCGQHSMSRVVCNKCDQFYCRYCRPFPIFNMKCPIGHDFQKRDVKNKNYVCDICQINPVIIGTEVYEDFYCNVGICGECFKNWPTFQKKVGCYQNLNNYCQIPGRMEQKLVLGQKQYKKLKLEHKLIILNERVYEKCSWCEKQKLCYKKCQKCMKFYCFTCKFINVFNNVQCQFGHLLTSKKVQNGESASPFLVTCFKCTNPIIKQQQDFFVDKDCNFILCKKCLQDSIQYSADVIMREFNVNYKRCPQQNHINFLLPYKNFKQKCYLCLKIKQIKIQCGICQNYRRYCCSCLPPNEITKCYCGRDLVQTNDLGDNLCYYCDKICQNQIYGCRNCYYRICQICIQQYSEKQQSKQKQTKLQKQQEEKKPQLEQQAEKHLKLDLKQKPQSTQQDQL